MSKRNFSKILTVFLLAGFYPTTFSQENPLEGSSWQLSVIYGFNDSEFIPANPENYLLRFRMDNRLQIEADCNQAGATWNLDGNQISLSELATTRKLCLSPSLFNRYVMNLNRAESFEISEDRLIIRTTSTADWMEFEPYVFTPSF
ncbi:MAG: META domain-containing protein [Gammaproteobacteria bacterium]|nr:META domain-containing protein [Gammaproteobacteria bacterium]